MKRTLPFLFLLSAYFSYGQWTEIDIPTGDILTSVHFKNDETGFICTQNRVFKTINGGQDWTLSYEGENLFRLEDIKTFGNNMVIAVGLDFNNGQSLVVRSENGGDTWSRITVTSSSFLKNLFFVDGTTGFCCGGNGVIFKTTNAGLFWALQSSGLSNDLQAIFFPDALTGFAAGGSPGIAKLLKSNNGGASWAPLPVTATSYLQSVYFTSPQTGYLVGWDGGIFKTTDAGISWTPQNSVNMAGNLEVVFTDAQTGYIVGGSSSVSSIQKTVDGGAVWTETAPGTSEGLVSICFPSAQTGYAVGENGTVLKTTNGATSSGSPETLSSVRCYPNPVSGILTIEMFSPDMKSVKLYNNGGALISDLSVGSEKMEIDFSSLPAGNYYLVFEGEKDGSVRKVVKI